MSKSTILGIGSLLVIFLLVGVWQLYESQRNISSDQIGKEGEPENTEETSTTTPQIIEPLPQLSTVVGYWECLPLKPGIGEVTLECALGIAIDQSDGHYAVDTALMSQYPVDFPTGTKVRVTGVITPVEALSSIQKFDIDGVLRATTIEKVVTAQPSLMGKQWKLVRAEFNDERVFTPTGTKVFSFTLDGVGTFTATTDCNSVGGRYALAGNTLTFTDIYSTKMFCEGSLEREFVQILENTANYHFAPSGELILALKFDSGTATFK